MISIQCILLLTYFTLVQSTNEGIFANFSRLANISSIDINLFEDESVTVNGRLKYAIVNQSFINKNVIVKCWMENILVGLLENWSDVCLLSNSTEQLDVDLKVNLKAKRLGGSHLYCGVGVSNGNRSLFMLQQQTISYLIVKRIPTIQELIFRFVVIFFVVFLTFVMGCGLEREIIINYLKRPISPAIGFLCQFIFMPLMSLGLAKLTNIENAFGFGLLTIGCSPGGGASNVWTVLFGGDLNLSMTMTFISSCAALFMMPFWLFVLGRFFLDPTIVKVPYTDIGLNLLQVVVPVGFGMLFRWKFESKAILLAKKIKIMGLLFVIFILTFGSYANAYIYKLMSHYPYLLPIGAGLPWLGFVFGLIMSLITRRSKPQAVAIAIETGFQNIGIALLILKFSMPQPGGDLGAVMPVIVALFTPLPLYIGLLVVTIKRKCCDKKKDKQAKMSTINDQKDILLEDKASLPI